MARELESEQFEAKGQRAWARRTTELLHVISLQNRGSWYYVQWGIVCPPAISVLYGEWKPNSQADIAAAAVTGTASSIKNPPSCGMFRLDPKVEAEALQKVVNSLPGDVAICARHMNHFQTRKDVKDHLLENRDDVDRRDFVVPANLPLKLLVATTLAALDGAPDTSDLLSETERASTNLNGDISSGRLSRLRDLIAARQGQL